MAASSVVRFTLALPPRYRAEDLLAFHRRDPEQVAERVEGRALAKGLAWGGRPACLRVAVNDGEAAVRVELDGEARPDDEAGLQALARRMLGLGQPVEAFERAHAGHPEVGSLIARNPGLRVSQAATPFEALTWAIIGQQISVHAATAVRRRVIGAAGVRHSAGLLCYPDADGVRAVRDPDLRATGLSGTKVRTLRALAEAVAAGDVSLEGVDGAADAQALGARLQAIRGIGPWTVNYALLRGFGWVDGSMEGDLGVRRGLKRLRGEAAMPDERATRAWLAPFRPWRALVAAHLWALPATE